MADHIDRDLSFLAGRYPEQREGIEKVAELVQILVDSGDFPAKFPVDLFPSREFVHPMFRLDQTGFIIESEGGRTTLTSTESRILTLLARNQNLFVPIEGIVTCLSGSQDGILESDFNSLKKHMYKIRKKIVNGRDIPSPIVNLRGFGFGLFESPEKAAELISASQFT